MIETRYAYTQTKEKVIEKVVDLDNVAINHMVLPPGDRLPRHESNSNVYMIVGSGALTLGLGYQEPHRYAAGSIVGIPMGVTMDVMNKDEEAVEFFVVKAPGPRSFGGGK